MNRDFWPDCFLDWAMAIGMTGVGLMGVGASVAIVVKVFTGG